MHYALWATEMADNPPFPEGEKKRKRSHDRLAVSRQLARALKLLGMLQAGGRTVDQIADRLGVGRRTVFRDLRAMRSAGFLVKSERGTGRLSLDPGERVLGRTLTAQELHALALATKTSVLDASPELAPVIDSALAKLFGATQSTRSYEIYRSALHCRIDLPQNASFGGPGVLLELLEGTLARVSVDLTLRDEPDSGEKSFRFRPFGIQVTSDGICFIGQCSDQLTSTKLPLSTIEFAQRTQEKFVVPENGFARVGWNRPKGPLKSPKPTRPQKPPKPTTFD